ncbi:MAG: hypothetical protein K8T25_01455 [Planctomycetia bacterium]|nr:hypothetical protein [Planctomycetia bacterium]
MSTAELMGWDKKMLRWQKRYRGKLYTVSPRQLKAEKRTKDATRTQANQWWRSKKAEIDDADRQDTPELPVDDKDRKLTIRVPVPPEIGECLDSDEASPQQKEIFKEWAGRVTTKFRYHRDRFLASNQDHSPRQTMGHYVQDFIDTKRKQAQAGQFALSRFESYRCDIEHFGKWVGADQRIDVITARKLSEYHTHLTAATKAGILAPDTASNRLTTVKQFIQYLWEDDVIELPKNIKNPRLSIKKVATKNRSIPVDVLTQLVDAALPRTKLWLLLMMNCAYTQTDISKLRHEEVDWRQGRIIRKRSKTDRHDDVPAVNYELWPETFRLLKKFRSRHENLVFLNDDGQPLVQERIADGKFKKSDAIKNAYWRLQLKTKSKTRYPLKLTRKTSATLLAGHETYGRFTNYFLGLSPRAIKDRHYVTPAQDLFDAAVEWLGRQYKQILTDS